MCIQANKHIHKRKSLNITITDARPLQLGQSERGANPDTDSNGSPWGYVGRCVYTRVTFPAGTGPSVPLVRSPALPFQLPISVRPTCGWRKKAFRPVHLPTPAAASKVLRPKVPVACHLLARKSSFLTARHPRTRRAFQKFQTTTSFIHLNRCNSRAQKIDSDRFAAPQDGMKTGGAAGAGKVGRNGTAGGGGAFWGSVGPHHHRFHLFGRSPVLHQEVDHALRLDEQVAAEEEDAEDHGEREHAHNGDLHHAHDVQAALVRAALGEAVVGHHGRLGAAAQGPLQRLAAVGQQ